MIFGTSCCRNIIIFCTCSRIPAPPFTILALLMGKDELNPIYIMSRIIRSFDTFVIAIASLRQISELILIPILQIAFPDSDASGLEMRINPVRVGWYVGNDSVYTWCFHIFQSFAILVHLNDYLLNSFDCDGVGVMVVTESIEIIECVAAYI